MMNVLETPPFVYERMLSTTDIYYFSEPEKALLERGAADVEIAGTMQEADAFVAAHSDIVERRRLVPPAEAQDAAIAPDARPRDAAPAAPVGVDHLEDLDFFGADLIPTGVRDVSLSGCGRIRRDDTRCAAYSYMVETRWCWPKSGVENVSAARGVVSGVLDYAGVDPQIFDRPFREGTGIDLVGFDILPDGLRNTSLAQCRRSCEADGDCVAFSWVAHKNWCFPKDAVGARRPAIGTISGVRR